MMSNVLRRFCLLVAKPVCNEKVFSARGLKISIANHCAATPDAAFVVTYKELKVMLASHTVQLFDVRNIDEFQAGRIPGSTNIPLGELEKSLQLPPQQFQQNFHAKIPHKTDDNIVFHCRSGKRSLSALEIAHRLGFSKARHYSGGFLDWEKHDK